MATVLEENKSFTDKVKMFDFEWLMGGMFLWVEINIFTHTLASQVEPWRLMRALWVHCTTYPYLILTVPGQDFAATDMVKATRGVLFFRFCFAAVEENVLQVKTKAFTDACRDFWKIGSVEEIDEILRSDRTG
ncbi:aromatic amino acid aminotransferase [Fusarium beomiforme]|uniref:Aromatic amino acid aminotransferase n=1 Tax=Fusarium beomiforme TaxID=44412 RepID=A0A9P5DPZ3_9HYPO|nr:aromatic amino acid aminotransferase [Fusarium beomiforme]